MFLDSSILDNYLETSDSKNYTLKKDLVLNDLNLVFGEGEILTIPEKVTLINKRKISLLAKGSQIINIGNIENLNDILVRKKEKMKETSLQKKYITKRQSDSVNNASLVNTGNYSGGVQINTPVQPNWPSISELISITNTNPSVTTKRSEYNTGLESGQDYIIYTAIYSFIQNGSGTNSISLNSKNLPSDCSYYIKITSVGAGGGGGSSYYVSSETNGTYYDLGQGGYSGSIISNPTASLSYNSNDIETITINLSNGMGGATQNPPTSSAPDIGLEYDSKYHGLQGGNTTASVYIQNSEIYSHSAVGGAGGYCFGQLVNYSPFSLKTQQIYPNYTLNNTTTTLTESSLDSCPTQTGGYCVVYLQSLNIPNINVNALSAQASGIFVSGGGGGFNNGESGSNGTNTYDVGGLSPDQTQLAVGIGCGGAGAGINASGTNYIMKDGQPGGDGYTEITITCSKKEYGVNPSHLEPGIIPN
jgi:hypothetical protein